MEHKNNSEVEEIDIKTDQKLDVMMEINMKTEDMINKLDRIYNDWEKLDNHVKPLEYKIVRHEKDVLLKTNAIIYVVIKMDSQSNAD